MTIGENIRKLRNQRGLTQRELSKICGINEAQIRRYELGGKNSNPKIETLQKIAIGLNVSIGDLLGTDFLKYATDYADFHTSIIEKANKEEETLLADFRNLNSVGREEAIKRVHELTEIKKYVEIEEAPTE